MVRFVRHMVQNLPQLHHTWYKKKIILKTLDEIMSHWPEHFRDLFHKPSSSDVSAIDSISYRANHPEIGIVEFFEERTACIKQINSNKALDVDSIPVELLKYGGRNVHCAVQSSIWIDAILITLYKGKGKKDFHNYSSISLLEVGNVFARALRNRLEKYISPGDLLESQCSLRVGKVTVDMILSAKQLVGKCIENFVHLCQVFVDVRKAFNSVNREAVWKLLGKFGFTNTFIERFKQLNGRMKRRTNFNRGTSIDNAVKPGDIC